MILLFCFKDLRYLPGSVWDNAQSLISDNLKRLCVSNPCTFSVCIIGFDFLLKLVGWGCCHSLKILLQIWLNVPEKAIKYGLHRANILEKIECIMTRLHCIDFALVAWCSANNIILRKYLTCYCCSVSSWESMVNLCHWFIIVKPPWGPNTT